MTDPKVFQAARSYAQEKVRAMVARELRLNPINVSKMSPVEEALIRAHYNHDRRLG